MYWGLIMYFHIWYYVEVKRKERLDLISAGTRLKCLHSSQKCRLPRRSLAVISDPVSLQFPPQNKSECSRQIRFNEVLSECIRPFILSKGKQYARMLLRQLRLSEQTDQLNSNERISTGLPSFLKYSVRFHTNSLWIRAKWSFSLLSLVLSTLSTLLQRIHWGSQSYFKQCK